MAINDTDLLLVAEGQNNYAVTANDFANYVNTHSSSGGGGGSSPGGGGTELYGTIEILPTTFNGNFDTRGAQLMKGVTPGSNDTFVGAGQKVPGNPKIAVFGYVNASTTMSDLAIFNWMAYAKFDLTVNISDLEVIYTCNGGLFGTELRSHTQSGSERVTSTCIKELRVLSGMWVWGCHDNDISSHYPKLETIQGAGSFTTIKKIPTLKYVDPQINILGTKGDYDFRDTALSVETIINWISKLDLNSTDFKSQYFKTLRFDGGTAATYEDLPTGAQERITELQGLGYTIVMNGTGDSSTINVTAGNVALIIQTDDGRYVPIKASTSAAIFPPTGYTNVTQYAGLAAAKTVMDSYVTGFDATRLYDEIQTTDIGFFSEVITTIGSAVSLDATLSNNPESATVEYEWFKVTDKGKEEIPNANGPIIQTSSITNEKLGTYCCQLTLTHAASDRRLSFDKFFKVKLAEDPTPNSVFIGAS